MASYEQLRWKIRWTFIKLLLECHLLIQSQRAGTPDCSYKVCSLGCSLGQGRAATTLSFQLQATDLRRGCYFGALNSLRRQIIQCDQEMAVLVRTFRTSAAPLTVLH